ncbi:MAG TPA: hypothetical protein VFF16_01665, partial [Telluria sp.]|nr:hypothetical protein [Telluria sp.]
MIALMENRKGIADQLRTLMYAAPALVPATPWLAEGTPAAPRALAHRDKQGIALKLAGGPLVTHFALWARYGNEWRFSVAPAVRGAVAVPDDPRLGHCTAIFVSAVDRVGMESPRVPVTLP